VTFTMKHLSELQGLAASLANCLALMTVMVGVAAVKLWGWKLAARTYECLPACTVAV
jgi:hypothetical protein